LACADGKNGGVGHGIFFGALEKTSRRGAGKQKGGRF
jgi:hypothetical protein